MLRLKDVPQFLMMQSGTECLRLTRHKGKDEKYLAALKVMARTFPENKGTQT